MSDIWDALTRHLTDRQRRKVQPALDFTENAAVVTNASQANEVVRSYKYIGECTVALVGKKRMDAEDRNELFQHIACSLSQKRNALIGSPGTRGITNAEVFTKLCETPEGAAIGFGWIELNRKLAQKAVYTQLREHRVPSHTISQLDREELLTGTLYGGQRRIDNTANTDEDYLSQGLAAAVAGYDHERGVLFYTYALAALKSGVSVDLKTQRMQSPPRLEADILDEGEDAHSYMEGLKSIRTYEENHAASIDGELLRARLQESLRSLAPRQREVIELRMGLRNGHEYTLREVANAFGVTPERIREIETRALRKLQHPVRSERLEAFLPPLSKPVFEDRLPDNVAVVRLAQFPSTNPKEHINTRHLIENMKRMGIHDIGYADEEYDKKPLVTLGFHDKREPGGRSGMYVVITCDDLDVLKRVARCARTLARLRHYGAGGPSM